MGVRVLVIVATRQRSKLPIEALPASIVFAGLAPAVPAPVAEGFDEYLQRGLIGEYGPTLAHGDMVRRIEAYRCDVAEGADFAVAVRGAEGVAAVFDQPQVVLPREGSDGIQIKHVPQGMGDDDRPGFFAARSFELIDVDFIGGQRDIHEDGHETVLKDGIYRGGKAGGDGDDLVARLELAFAQFGGSERAHG